MTICPVCGSELPPNSNYCRVCGNFIRDNKGPNGSSGDNLDSSEMQNVRRCAFCSKPLIGEDAMYFRCRYCGQEFCNEHRLPENHLCRSAPSRRTVPSGGVSSGGYWSSSSGAFRRSGVRVPGGSWFHLSVPGRNLAIAIVAGLIIGFILNLIPIGGNGNTLVYYFVQFNLFVYNGWIPPLITSAIVVFPNSSGMLDVFFNAISVIWIDGILSSAYTAKQYYIVFILTALAGNLLTLLYGPFLISFGASGGIFGLLTGALTAEYARTRTVNRSLVLWVFVIFVYSTFTGGVNVFAHLGGALFGLVVGYIVGKRNSPRRSGYY